MLGKQIGVAFAAVVSFAACSNTLTKEKARELLKDNFYAIDSNMYCALDELVSMRGGSGTPRTFKFIGDDEMGKCSSELVAAGILVAKNDLYMLGEGFTKADKVQWPCGKKVLGEVTSVSTEADKKKASVHYKRTFTLDAALKKSLADCKVDGAEGEREETIAFTCDDDGEWMPPGKASPPGPALKPPPPPKPFEPCAKVVACCSPADLPPAVQIACSSAKANRMRKDCDGDATAIRNIYADRSFNPATLAVPAACSN